MYMCSKLFFRFLYLTPLIALMSCSPGYVIRAAYEQSKILLCREDIEEALKSPDVSAEEKVKLQYVIDARTFAKKLSLEPKESFTKYASIDRDVLSWVVLGCKKDRFEPRGWWFPIIGTVPYKGFFEKDDAIEQARELEAEGYETWVRGTDAYSTLGWFNDPILSTTLKRPVPDIVNTVLHETLHTTYWFPNFVDFNESLANYVGMQGAILFFKDQLARCHEDTQCITVQKQFLESVQTDFGRNMEISLIMETLFSRLDTLYKSQISTEEKLSKREAIFSEILEPIHAKYPTMKALQKVNNAEILQLKIYVTDLDLFDKLFKAHNEDFSEFMKEIHSIWEAHKAEALKSPHDLVKERLGSLTS